MEHLEKPGMIGIINMKTCKHCGTTKEDDFVRSTGQIGKTSCSKCFCKNIGIRSKNNKHRTGKKHSKETREKISNSLKGRKLTEEHCKNMRETLEGRKLTEEHKKNISESLLRSKHHKNRKGQNKGRVISLDTRKKISSALKGRKGKTGNKQSLKTKEMISNSQKYSVVDYRKKYKLFCKIEEIRDVDSNIGEPGIQVICKKCNNWFIPTQSQISSRIWSIEHKNGKGGCYFYCSEKCKHNCELHGLNTAKFLNDLNRVTSNIYTNQEYQTWRTEVLKRQNERDDYNHCEYCNSEEKLHCHHEKPQKTHPHLALDPDNGVVFCEECHYGKGHVGECSTGRLANLVCV